MNEATATLTADRRARPPLAIAFASAMLAGSLAFAPATPAFAQARPTNLADLVDSVAEAVVNISATQTVDDKEAGAPNLPKGTPFDEMFEEFFRNHGINPASARAPGAVARVRLRHRPHRNRHHQ